VNIGFCRAAGSGRLSPFVREPGRGAGEPAPALRGLQEHPARFSHLHLFHILHL
jgi:hypothetical protein